MPTLTHDIPPTLMEEICRDLNKLKLGAMAEAFQDLLDEAQTTQQGYATFLSALVKKQLLSTHASSTRRRIHSACFPEVRTFDSFNWTFQPGLNVQLLKDLMILDFIRQARTVLIFGKPGTGKTHISLSLGYLAAEAGYRVRFYSATTLLNDLYASLADNSTDALIQSLARLDLLIIDDIRHLPPRPEFASLLYELIETRHQKKAIIVSSNLGVNQWGSVLGNPTLTASMVDRLMHGAHILNIKPGRSYRSEGPDSPPESDRPSDLRLRSDES